MLWVDGRKEKKPALEESPTQKTRSSWPYPRQTEGPSHTGWTARIGLSERTLATKTLRRRVLALGGRITRSARRLTLHLPKRWPWGIQFIGALARLRAFHS